MDNQEITRKLTAPLQFNIFTPQVKGNIFDLVIDGKITKIAAMIQNLQKEEIPAIINSKDLEGKTPLFYACYYNFQNIVLYLLTKQADPFLIGANGITVFHVCAFRGHLECVMIINQYLRHLGQKKIMDQLKVLMLKYGFKKTDAKNGQLISLDKNIKSVQTKFMSFQDEVQDLFQHHLENLYNQYVRVLTTFDTLGRSPIHWGGLSKYAKSLKTIQFILIQKLDLDGWNVFMNVFNDISQLELSKEAKVDPRHSVQACHICKNFIEFHVYDNIMYQYTKQMVALEKESINTQDKDGLTPMHLASFAGDFKAIQFFLSIGGNPKIKAMEKDVLEYAAHDMVRKYMIDLKNAAREGDTKSFNILINCGHHVDGPATIYAITPLHNVMRHTNEVHSEDMFNEVIKMDPNVNQMDSNGWTPLHHACSFGNVQSVLSLIDKKSSLQAFSNKGYYPLHVAAIYEQPDVIEVLVQKGANIENQDNLKCTALHLAARKGNSKSVLKLLELGANVYAQDVQKWTALHHASFNGHQECVHILCRYDGDHDKLRQMETTRGQQAKDLMPNESIRFALETTWRSAINGHIDSFRKLLILKHDINEKTRERQQTPLILASKNGHLTMVRFMLDKGADKQIKDIYYYQQDGKTAIDYARQAKHFKIVALLEGREVQD